MVKQEQNQSWALKPIKNVYKPIKNDLNNLIMGQQPTVHDFLE